MVEYKCYIPAVGADRTDKIENLIFLIHKEIQNGAIAQSYMTNVLLIFAQSLIY
jgi:hypothetical protein